jgi:homopolymeric O-antigen transport system permease protein
MSAIVEGHLEPTIIEPSRGWRALDIRELWAYRELVGFLATRDLKVRYQQTTLGIIWVLLQPVLMMVVFSVFLGRLSRVPSNGLPYPLFTYAALVPWTLFATALSQSSNSLVARSNLITKIYFPRLLLPVADVLSACVDFAIAATLLVVLMVWYHVAPGGGILLLPLFALLAIITALGVGLWLSALNVEYRDVRYVLPFLVQAWLFVTPIAYPSSVISGPWHVLYGLNPMVGVVEGFRWALTGVGTAPGWQLALSCATSIVVLISGAYYFRRLERHFADVI